MPHISAHVAHEAGDGLGRQASLPSDTRGKENAGGDIHDVYSRLRQLIISGAIEPREILNQVHIAKQFGVSRTPVREALRILQTENLVETNHQHKVRVTEITPREVDSVYGTWILIQALGTSLTVPRLTDEELVTVRHALKEMSSHRPSDSGPHSEWDDSHINFHRSLVMHAGPVILESIESCWSRSERARRTYMRASLQSYAHSDEEHATLVEAYSNRDVASAVYISSRQLARIARVVMGNIDPAYEPVAIRDALALLSANVADQKPRRGR